MLDPEPRTEDCSSHRMPGWNLNAIRNSSGIQLSAKVIDGVEATHTEITVVADCFWWEVAFRGRALQTAGGYSQ
jgi:hypothetical protein